MMDCRDLTSPESQSLNSSSSETVHIDNMSFLYRISEGNLLLYILLQSQEQQIHLLGKFD